MEISRRKMLLGVERWARPARWPWRRRPAVTVDLEALRLGRGCGGGRGPALGVGRAGRSAGRVAARPGRRAPGQPAAQVVDLQLPTAAGRAPRRRAGIREQARQLPSWVDQGKLQTAGDFYKKRGLYLGLLYGFGSSMMSCAIPNEARAVYYSKGGSDMRDRITKTGKLGHDIGDLNAYQPGGDMVVTAVKTRMVHAAVRHLLPQSPWWPEVGGRKPIPISQADIMVTWRSWPPSPWAS